MLFTENLESTLKLSHYGIVQWSLRKQTPACYQHCDGSQLPRHLSHFLQLHRLHLRASFPGRWPPLSCRTRADVPYRVLLPHCWQGCLHWDREVRTAQQHKVLSVPYSKLRAGLFTAVSLVVFFGRSDQVWAAPSHFYCFGNKSFVSFNRSIKIHVDPKAFWV